MMPAENPMLDSPGLQPAGSPPAGENLDPEGAKQVAAALHDAAKATNDLGQATQQVVRLNRNDPALAQLRERIDLTKKLTQEQQRAASGNRGGGVSRGVGAGAVRPGRPTDPRHNPALDEAFGVVQLTGATATAGTAQRMAAAAVRPVAPHQSPAIAAEQERAEQHEQRLYPKEFRTSEDRERRELRDMRDRMAERGHKLDGEEAKRLHELNASHARRVDLMTKAGNLPAGYTEKVEAPPPATAWQRAKAVGGRVEQGVEAGREFGGNLLNTVAKMAAVTGNYYESETSAYTTGRERTNRFFDTLPFVGELSRAADHEDDAKKYTVAGVRSMKERMFRSSATAELETQRQLGPVTTAREMVDRETARREANAKLGGVRIVPESTARTTVDEQRKYGENRELVDVMEKYRAKRLDATAADREALKIAERRTQLEGKIIALQYQAERDEKKVKELDKQPGEPGYDPESPPIDLRNALNNLAMTREVLSGYTAEASRLKGQETATRNRATTLKREEKMAFADVGEVTLEQERRAELKSATGARNLGLMGVDGRMSALVAKRAVDQIGVENAPGELIQMARPAFPETIDNMAEVAGAKFQGQLRPLAPSEPGLRDLSGLRASVDALEKGVATARNKADAEGMAEVVDRLTGVLDDLLKQKEEENVSVRELKAKVQSLEADARLKNQR